MNLRASDSFDWLREQRWPGKRSPFEITVSYRHRLAGRIGGIRTYMRYGSVYMSQIGHKGGRPTREEAACKAWKTYQADRKRAGWRGH